MLAPEFDKDGYPTIDTLNKIKTWNINNKDDCTNLLDFIRKAWKYQNYIEVSVNYIDKKYTKYELSTGGWAGNEDLIDAMSSNLVFWNLTWYSSRRGGHYEFRV